MTPVNSPIMPELRKLLTCSPAPERFFGVLAESNRNAELLSGVKTGLAEVVGSHTCVDCGDTLTVPVTAGVVELQEFWKWRGRHEACDHTITLRAGIRYWVAKADVVQQELDQYKRNARAVKL